jgi:hypothetical protein
VSVEKGGQAGKSGVTAPRRALGDITNKSGNKRNGNNSKGLKGGDTNPVKPATVGPTAKRAKLVEVVQEEDVKLAYGRLGVGARSDHFVDNLDLRMISKAFARTRFSCANASGSKLSLDDLSDLDTTDENAEVNLANQGVTVTADSPGDFGSAGFDIDLDLLDEDGVEDFHF